MADLEADKYNAQTSVQAKTPYEEGVYEDMMGEVLAPAKYVGSISSAYRTLDVTGILPVQAKLYSNRVSPVLGWKGQELPKTNPAQANPDINWLMDLNTADLYTYRGVYTPGTEDMESYAGDEEQEEAIKAKSWVYENAPVKSQIFSGSSQSTLGEAETNEYASRFQWSQ